jgi:hypothetical protein
MKRLQVLFVLLFTVLFSYTVVAQELGLLKKECKITFPEKIHKLVLEPLPAGTYSIGIGGYFTTIQSAFDKLNTDGIAGEVILELTDNLYIAPTDSFGFFLNGPIPGAGPDSRVTIKPAANKNVTIEGNGLCAVSYLNTSYLTVDGVGLSGATTLTIHALYNAQFQWNGCAEFYNNSDHNVVQNVTFISEDYTRQASNGSAFWTLSGFNVSPDSNLIQNNFIKKAGMAIYVSSYYASVKAVGNIIRGNRIGSGTDSLVTWPIQVEHGQNTIIENNIVQNIRYHGYYYSIGINSYWGSTDVIRNNIVHNINANNSPGGSFAIGLSGSAPAGQAGSNNQVYNNMVYDIRSSSTQQNSRVAGIQMWAQNNPKIYYNSVYLSGNGANPLGSAALYLYGGFGGITNVEAKNNIFVNIRDESPYCASSIYDYSASNLTSDYNDLYYEPNGNNCLVRAGGTDYLSLVAWQATGQDLNSVTEMPNFVSPDLHIDWTIFTLLDGHATPIAGITTDIDNEPRNVTIPDIGADEFVYVPVELKSFTASVNGKEVVLNWSTATETNNQGFDIERSEDNISFNKIGFVPGFGTTTEPKSYSYSDHPFNSRTIYYRLRQVDYDGSYEYSNVVEVEINSPTEYMLAQNFPNPFNPTTTIDFGIKEKSNVKIIILNAIGEEVAVVLNEEREPGFHQVEFSAANLPSGVYFYQLKAGSFIETKKMLLLK